MPPSMTDAVTVHIDAPPGAVWGLVADVTQIGRFSPETFEAEWIAPSTGPEPGARFRGHVKRNERGPTYWTTCEVQRCAPGEVFSFGVVTGGKVLNVWSYEMEPDGEGTKVTESFALADTPAMRLYWTLLGRFRGKRNRNDMRRTLEAIKAVAEADAAGGGA